MVFYNCYHFIKPCLAEKQIAPHLLQFYEGKKHLAQYKMNGTNNLIFIAPPRDGFREITCRTRHDTAHKAWQFTTASALAFEDMPTNGWYVFNAELLHSKTPTIKDTNFIHDILVYDSEYLLGKPYSYRYSLLHRIFEPKYELDNSYRVTQNTWIAKNFYKRFEDIFWALKGNAYEGLVIKDPEAKLDAQSSSGWLVKCKIKRAT